MSVGPNPSGITPKVAPTPVRAVQSNPGQSANAGPANKANPNPASLRAQGNQGNFAQAIANAFNPAFMIATGAIAAVTNRKKASDVSGDAKEGEGQVGLETEAEAQPDALQESDQEQGAGEITEAGTMSGPAT